jgi:hypothetical protein
MQVLPSIASREKHRNHSTPTLPAKKESGAWGRKGNKKQNRRGGEEGFSTTRETKFPKGELWEQFEPKVWKQCSPISEFQKFLF